MPQQNYVATRAFTSNATHYAVADPVPKDLPGFGTIKAKGLVALDNSDEGVGATERRSEMDEAARRREASADEALSDTEKHARTLRELEEEAAPKRMGEYEEEPPSEAPPPAGLGSTNPTPPLENAPLPGREFSRVGPESPGGEPASSEGPEFASDAAEERARELGLSAGEIEGTGSGGKITKADVERAATESDEGSEG